MTVMTSPLTTPPGTKPTGGTCSTCGAPAVVNGRKELLHIDYMEHAYDHAVTVEELHTLL
jgi:NADH:ubiquinone oxidoreductase subunit E